MAQHQVITRMDTVATKLESAGAMRLAYMVDTVANTVSSGHDKNAGLLDLVKRPLAKALNAGVSKLLGNRKVQEAAAAIAKKVPVADLRAAFDNEELLSKVREFAARMGPSDLEEMLRSPEEYEHKLLAKIGLPGSKTAASGLSKGVLMAMTLLMLMKTVPAGEMPSQIGAGHGPAHTTLDSSHGGDTLGGDSLSKVPDKKEEKAAPPFEWDKRVAEKLPGFIVALEDKSTDSSGAYGVTIGALKDALLGGDSAIGAMVAAKFEVARKVPVVHKAINDLLKGSSAPVPAKVVKTVADAAAKIIWDKMPWGSSAITSEADVSKYLQNYIKTVGPTLIAEANAK